MVRRKGTDLAGGEEDSTWVVKQDGQTAKGTYLSRPIITARKATEILGSQKHSSMEPGGTGSGTYLAGHDVGHAEVREHDRADVEDVVRVLLDDHLVVFQRLLELALLQYQKSTSKIQYVAGSF
jgi:hypothetical protein